MMQQQRLLSPCPLNWGAEPRPLTPIKQTAGPCRVTSSVLLLQHQHGNSSYSFIPAITTTNIPVPLRLTTYMDYPVQLTSSFLFAFHQASYLPRVINTSFTAPLHFRDNYFFVDSVPTFGKTVYLKRDFKSPGRALEITLEIQVEMVHGPTQSKTRSKGKQPVCFITKMWFNWILPNN